MSDSRVFIVTSVLIYGCFFVTRRARSVSMFTAFTFTALLLVMVGIWIQGVNPFSLFKNDNSGQTRTVGFDIIQRVAFEHPILGVGRLSFDKDSTASSWDSHFYVSDYGIFGVFFEGGLVGVLLYGLVIVFALFSSNTLSRVNLPAEDAAGVAVGGCIIALYSVISPSFWMDLGAGAVMGGLFIALQLLPAGEAMRGI
jgi:hypothetical protein